MALATEKLAWIDVIERRIEGVRIPVESLTPVRSLHERIGSQEPPDRRVINASSHIDQAKLRIVLVTGEAGKHAGRS